MKNLKHNISGFTLIEVVTSIVMLSLLAVSILAYMAKPFNDKAINFNDISLIVNNSEQLFKSWIRNVGPTPNVAASYHTDGYSVDCSASNPALICRNDLGDNVKYTINANVVSDSISPGALLTTPLWNVNLTVSFYTRTSASSSWVLYTSANKTFKVLQ